MSFGIATMKNEEGVVGLGGDEAELLQMSGESLKPSARRLFQAVEQLP